MQTYVLQSVCNFEVPQIWRLNLFYIWYCSASLLRVLALCLMELCKCEAKRGTEENCFSSWEKSISILCCRLCNISYLVYLRDYLCKDSDGMLSALCNVWVEGVSALHGKDLFYQWYKMIDFPRVFPHYFFQSLVS